LLSPSRSPAVRWTLFLIWFVNRINVCVCILIGVNMMSQFLPLFLHRPLLTVVMAMSAVLAGCGGGSSSPTVTPVITPEVPNPVGAGHFEAATFIQTINAADVAAALNKDVAAAIRPLYAVDTYKITYTTSDAAGRSVIASGLAAIPQSWQSGQSGIKLSARNH
jgi:hypothetical protein